MSNLFIDFETRCAVPIYYGTDLYTRACEPIIATWAVDDDLVRTWDITSNAYMPADLYDALEDERVTITAHNANFDRNALKYGLHWPTPVERWRCTSAQARAHGLPGSLETLGQVLRLPDEYRKLSDDGHRLIQIFCVPDDRGVYVRPCDRPGDWATFLEYAARDTAALREIYRRLPSSNYVGSNLDVYWIDQRIGNRGFKIDVPLAWACVGVLGAAKQTSDISLSDATNGAVTAATQRQRLLNHLQRQCGLDIPNMKAATIRDYLEADDVSPEVRFLLQARLDGAKSAGAKYKRGLGQIGPGERIRHALVFGGAGRTGRWSGKGFQPHNMLRPAITTRRNGRLELTPVKASYIDDVIIPGIYSGDVLSSPETFGTANEACGLALRHTIVAADGNELVVADYSNIESVKLAWLAREEWKLELFRAKQRDPHNKQLDAYRTLYSRFFGTPIDKVNDNERQAGKVVELACGFGGSVGAFVTMAAGYNIDLDTLPALILPSADPDALKRAYKAWRRAFLRAEDFGLEADVFAACHVLVQKYRAANENINQMRHDIGNAVSGAIKEPGKGYNVARCAIWVHGGFLIIKLPSGRRLLYASPQIGYETEVDPDTGKETRREFVSYLTARGKSWHRERAWAGLFLENIVQGSANDILRIGLRAVHARTLRIPAIADALRAADIDERTAIVLHVHDEIVVEVPIGSFTEKDLHETITAPIPWCADLPLMADTWHGPRYGKR